MIWLLLVQVAVAVGTVVLLCGLFARHHRRTARAHDRLAAAFNRIKQEMREK